MALQIYIKFSLFFSGRESALRGFDNDIKALGVKDSDLSETLSVQLNICLVQAIDQIAVRDASHAARRVDSRDPQLSEFPLADFSVTESILARPNQRFLDSSQQIAATASITFSAFEKPFFGAVASGAFGSSHWFFLSSTRKVL